MLIKKLFQTLTLLFLSTSIDKKSFLFFFFFWSSKFCHFTNNCLLIGKILCLKVPGRTKSLAVFVLLALTHSSGSAHTPCRFTGFVLFICIFLKRQAPHFRFYTSQGERQYLHAYTVSSRNPEKEISLSALLKSTTTALNGIFSSKALTFSRKYITTL